MAEDKIAHFVQHASMSDFETVIKFLSVYEEQHPGETVLDALAEAGKQWDAAREEWGKQRDRLDQEVRNLLS
jgi:hypothetical protein